MRQEEWMAEVERRLREFKGDPNSLVITGEQNVNLFVPPSNPTEWFGEGEWIWISLNQKQQDQATGEYFYGWQEKIREPNPAGGYYWINGERFGALDWFPAIALNNDDIPIGDGKRYPARWNPDTLQWIFFLRRSSATPPADWPQGPYSCYLHLTGLSLTFPNIGATPGCGQTSYRDMFYKCSLDVADYPIKSVKVWITWEGIEKLVAWSEPQIVPFQNSYTIGLMPVSGYADYNDNLYFPLPTSGTVSVRWEVEINNSVDGMYAIGTGPRTLRWEDCDNSAVPDQFQNPGSVTVSGTGLTGSSTADCYFRQIPMAASVNCAAAAGPAAPKGSIGGFRVEIIAVDFAGQDAGNPGNTSCEMINLQAEADVLEQLLLNATWNIGNPQSGDCSENTLNDTEWNDVNPPIVNSVARTYHTIKLVRSVVRSFIGGITDALVVNHSLKSSCTNTGADGYLTSLPPADIRWHGNSINIYPYAFSEISYPSVPAWGSEETRTTIPNGGIEFYSSKALPNCKVDSGMSEQWTTSLTFMSEYGVWTGDSFYVYARCYGLIDVTLKLTYLG